MNQATASIGPGAGHPALLDPWAFALARGAGTVMAVLTATHGPAYRDRGAAMAIGTDGSFAGALSSGCIEADIILNAARVRASGAAMRLRYGAGSPFLDLRLPCGGAIEVLLFEVRDPAVLADLARARRSRLPVSLRLSAAGRLSLHAGATVPVHAGPDAPAAVIPFPPQLRFVIFGAGAEAAVFADLARSLDYDHVLVSHEDRTLGAAEAMGCRVRRWDAWPDFAALVPDAGCAGLLFYHDHDYEPQILRGLLATPAFYIGAQGSRASQAARLQRLAEMRVPDHLRTRVRGPIGLIPSSRDPRMLAISVLSEVLLAARTSAGGTLRHPIATAQAI